ncbi:ABC transporter ATP-binding protein [Aurantivibrio infirmus]
MILPLLEVKQLNTYFGDTKAINIATKKGPNPANRSMIKVVDDVSFTINEGETVGLVGESGSGKSTVGLSLMRLNSPRNSYSTGEIHLSGRDIMTMSKKELRELRGRDITMVLQDLTALNPVYSVGNQIEEAIRCHEFSATEKLTSDQVKARVIESLKMVNIPDPDSRVDSHPHQLSGGMRQRVVGAMALACSPKLLIADEPTTALDVTVQAQYLLLLKKLQKETGISILLITHDFGVVAQMCDRVCVMYAGQIVENAKAESIFSNPAHWYTAALLKSMPSLSEKPSRLPSILGSPPALNNLPTGCRFAERCERAEDKCRQAVPPTTLLASDHRVRCWFPRGHDE